MPRILITIPRDRTRTGVLRFFSDDMGVRFECACLGKADNTEARKHGNASRDPKRPFGDSPVGTYRVLAIRSAGTSPSDVRSYGPHNVISIEGTSGDALAAKVNGRTGLLIHGGALSATKTLRPTHGCLRLSDADMASLHGAIAAHGRPAQVIVSEPERVDIPDLPALPAIPELGLAAQPAIPAHALGTEPPLSGAEANRQIADLQARIEFNKER